MSEQQVSTFLKKHFIQTNEILFKTLVLTVHEIWGITRKKKQTKNMDNT